MFFVSNYASFIRFFCLLLCIVGCTSTPADLNWNEGFFDLYNIPSERVQRLGNQASDVIKNVIPTVGALTYVKVQQLTFSEIEKHKKTYCSTEDSLKWFKEMCDQLEKKCTEKCKVRIEGHCGGAILSKNNFITSRHCPLGEDLKSLKVKVEVSAGKVASYPIIPKTKLEGTEIPFDLAIFEIVGPDLTKNAATIAMNIPKANEWIFSIGFPNFKYRTAKSFGYPDSSGQMRITFGQVVDPNEEQKAFCDFGFADTKIMLPELWKLSSDCPHSGEHLAINVKGQTYNAHVEKDPFLANIDILNGMSGAPVFDSSGKLIGIASGLLKNGAPFNYGKNNFAVIAKARNQKFLQRK